MRFSSVALSFARLLTLKHMFGIVGASSEDVKIECLPTTEDLDSFRCMAASSKKVPCIDADARCEGWSKKGECKNNPQYMQVHCRKSCSSCISLHSGDVLQIAPNMQHDRILERLYDTQNYLHRLAQRNVQSLQRCVNRNSHCTFWWAVGHCENEEHNFFLSKECPLACQTCK
mmetsp:Transcript_15434/g.31680  ORF Transcript_15434/g.31680 Transcript_15434/m.31680 type:complete len:173 (+) Transcript_15434:196-714(+)